MFKKLWALLRSKRKKKIPTMLSLVLDLGHIQIFANQTEQEVIEGVMPKELYWSDTNSGYTYGPFDTIADALAHNLWMVDNQGKKEMEGSVIYVDFLHRRRIELK